MVHSSSLRFQVNSLRFQREPSENYHNIFTLAPSPVESGPIILVVVKYREAARQLKQSVLSQSVRRTRMKTGRDRHEDYEAKSEWDPSTVDLPQVCLNVASELSRISPPSLWDSPSKQFFRMFLRLLLKLQSKLGFNKRIEDDFKRRIRSGLVKFNLPLNLNCRPVSDMAALWRSADAPHLQTSRQLQLSHLISILSFTHSSIMNFL